MEDIFELPVTYKGKEFMLPATLVTSGYSFKFRIDINDQIIYFERDEEGNFRALSDNESKPLTKETDPDFLKEIAASLNKIL